jgi:hypothetical protein
LSIKNVFTNNPEPEYLVAKKTKVETELADDPEKFEEPFERFDILQVIIKFPQYYKIEILGECLRQ